MVGGPFEGIRGRLFENRGQKRLLIGIEQIRQGISVEVNERDVALVVGQLSKPREICY